MSTHTAPKRFFWSRGDKALLITITVVVILAVLGFGWLRALNTEPAITVPTPVLPSPNAFDFYVAAGKAMMDNNKISYAISSRHSSPGSDPLDHDYTLAQKEALVAENSHALGLLRQGFAYDYHNPPVRSFSALLPYYAKFRGMARLLMLEGQVKEGRGDWGGAVESDLDAVRLGADIPRGSVLIGDLVGIACQAIGRYRVWDAASHLSAAQAGAAARRLEATQVRQVPFKDTLQEEKWTGQAALLEIMRRPNWRHEMASELLPAGDNNSALAFEMRTLFLSKRRVVDNYSGYMDRLIANARQPYAANPPPLSIPTDPVNQILAPIFSTAGLKHTENETQNALLATTLALRAYRLEHGAYPAALGELTPHYLTRVPDDPFALTGPLHYRRAGTSFVLYSVGPDGKDDGGRPIFDSTKSAPTVPTDNDHRYWVQQDSLGDVVAGVNKI